MPRVLPQYADEVQALSPILVVLPARIVGIDGRDGTGKTTLGRYLAWYFNVTLLESDLFILANRGDLKRRNEEILRIVKARLSIPRPIIIEGIGLFMLLRELELSADCLIYVRTPDHSTGATMERILQRYETEFRPLQRATLVLDLNHGAS